MTRLYLHPFETFDQQVKAPGRNQVLIRLNYLGAPFYGVPPQPGLPTVTDALQEQIKRTFGQPLKALTFTARTDKGVDADVNFATGWFRDGPVIPKSGLQISAHTNGLGTVDVAEVPQDVFARTISLSKTYTYRFRDNFLSDSKKGMSYWDIHPKLNLDLMQEGAAAIVGTHNFESFQVRPGKEPRNTRCTVFSTRLERCIDSKNSPMIFEICGESFLRRMVRTLAGTLAEIGCGLMPPETMKNLLETPNSAWVGPTAPARGLKLSHIQLKENLCHLFD
jgi:tRNA pseudouridine38-40 synthase